MAASKAPAKKPAKPVDVDIDYFFCSNPSCNYHASFLVSERPQDAGFVVGQLCPQCGIGTISILQFKQKADVPLAAAAVTAQALPALPYGGVALRLGDRDDQSIWGGVTDTDPRHVGAHFVAELQRDLLRLAFYGPARGGETPGQFSQMLHGGVLDLKRHLTKFYGIPALDDFTEVQRQASEADKSRAERAAQRAKARTDAGTGGGDTPADVEKEKAFEDAHRVPICFPPGGLVGPNEVYNLVNAWTKTLGQQTPISGALLVQTFEKWAALWQRIKSAGLADTPAALATLRNNVVSASTSRDGVKVATTQATRDQRRLALRIAGLKASRAKLNEAQIAPLESAMDALISDLNTNGANLQSTAAQVGVLDTQLPLSSATITQPAAAALTMTATTPIDSTPPARFDRVVADDATAAQVVRDQTALSAFIDRKVGNPKQDQRAAPQSLLGREGKLERDITSRDDLAALISATITDLDTDIGAAQSAAALINGAGSGQGKPTGAFVFARQNAITRASFWTQQAAPAQPAQPAQPGQAAQPAKGAVSDGTILGLIARMTALEGTFASSTPAIPQPPEWQGIKTQLGTLQATVVAYRDEIQKSNATTFMDSYIQLLRRFGIVDGATARYIRRMVTDGRLGSRPVFRTPQGAEILGFDFQKDLAAAVAETAKERGRADAPEPIVRFIFTHESGGAHTSTFGAAPTNNPKNNQPARIASPQIVKLGIDWKTPGDASFFKERETSGQQLSSSRGWGMTQTTFFETPALKVASTIGLDATPPAPTKGPDEKVNMHSGIPYPLEGTNQTVVPFVLTSARENAKSGIAIFISKFQNTQAKRECTFKTRHDCATCSQQLAVGSRQTDANGKTINRGGMVFFKEEEGDFDRVLVNGRIASHRFRSVESVKDKVASGDYSIPGKTVSTITEADTLEFPCSWLTAITNYAGAGQIAWYYALNGIVFLQTGKLPK